MMKRYIKMPLKYALPFLFIGSLALVSISGCTSQIPAPNNQLNTSTSVSASASATATPIPSVSPSPTPSATPSPTPSVTPSPTPSPQPVTGSFGQSSYVVANGTVVTATVSNWQSNPDVALGTTAHAQTIPMTAIGSGQYSYTMEGVILPYGSGSGGIALYDNGKLVAQAATTWSNLTPTPTPTPTPTATPTPTLRII
jgi:hypothetical protein